MRSVARIYRGRMNVRRMCVFREVARTGSISDAADALHFSSSAVSQQIRVLEKEVGVALFDRGPCSVTLTKAGWALVGHTDFIVNKLKEAEDEVRSIATLNGGRLRVATFRTAGEAFVAEALMYFRNRYPKVQLSLCEGEPEHYLVRVKRNELDLALSFEYDYLPQPGDDAIERIPLFTEPMLIALPEEHRLARRRSLALQSLADEDWIASTPRSAVHDFVRLACEAAGFSPRIRYETDDYHVAQGFVESGLGVALLPTLATQGLHRAVAVRAVKGHQPQRRVFVAHRPDGQRSPTVAAMVGVLQDLVLDLPNVRLLT